jgi:hypothetical protein
VSLKKNAGRVTGLDIVNAFKARLEEQNDVGYDSAYFHTLASQFNLYFDYTEEGEWINYYISGNIVRALVERFDKYNELVRIIGKWAEPFRVEGFFRSSMRLSEANSQSWPLNDSAINVQYNSSVLDSADILGSHVPVLSHMTEFWNANKDEEVTQGYLLRFLRLVMRWIASKFDAQRVTEFVGLFKDMIETHFNFSEFTVQVYLDNFNGHVKVQDSTLKTYPISQFLKLLQLVK